MYDAFNSMEKYSFGKAVSAVDVLTTRYEDNPDALLKVLFCVVDLLKLYKAQQYGSIIQILKGNKSIFSKESWNIQTHNAFISRQMFVRLIGLPVRVTKIIPLLIFCSAA